MKVGTICKLKVDCLGNFAGTLGVVFNDYGDGCQVIFENGCYDGFSETGEGSGARQGLTEADFYLEKVGFEGSLAGYQFSTVMRVGMDYRKGFFNIAWSAFWQKAAEQIDKAEAKAEHLPLGELGEIQICASLRDLSKSADPSLTVSLPAIKPSEMMDDKKAEQVDFEDVPLSKLLHFIADMM